MTKRNICITITALCSALLLLYEIFGSELFKFISDSSAKQLVDVAVTRALGAFVFISILVHFEYKVLSPVRKPFLKSILFCLPAFAVAVNNFPFSTVLKGEAVIDGPVWKIALLFAECFFVALFEEMAFRGVIFLGLAEKRRETIKGLFRSIVLSSAVFGAVHLLNLFTSSPIAVLMQIGYSFLIGAMCAVVLIKTANIWLCVLIHTIFNFSGAVVSTCGHGAIWNTFTIVLTAVIAVAVTVYMIVAFVRLDPRSVDRIYQK